MSTPRKQVILGAYLGGVNHHTAWWHPEAGSQIAFDSFEHTARTAERGKFDFFFLAEGLALATGQGFRGRQRRRDLLPVRQTTGGGGVLPRYQGPGGGGGTRGR